MSVEDGAHDSQNRKRCPGEDCGGDTVCPSGTVRYKCAGSYAVPIIVDRFFISAPPCFELPQARVIEVGPTEVEARKTLPAQPADCFPHNKVVGPQMLVLLVGGPILVDRSRTEMKIN